MSVNNEQTNEVDVETKTISQAYRDAQSIFQSLEESKLSSSDPKYQEKVEEAIRNLVRVGQYVKTAQLFSSNEELEDINTNYLKYLLVNYYLASLVLKKTNGDRLANLKTSLNLFHSFLESCEKLKLIHPDDIKAWQREQRLAPQALREEKINRYKREMEANDRLKELIRQKKLSDKKAESGYITTGGSNNNNTVDEDEGLELEDEEKQRDLNLLLLSIATRKAVEELDASKQEVEMLEQIEKLKLSQGGKLDLDRNPPTNNGQFKNFVLLPSKRDEFQSRVFKPTWNLPTMTVEEWAEEQMEKGFLPAPGQSNNNNNNAKKKNKDPEVEDEEELKKKRDWDDWKDDHPRGAGNRRDNYFKR